jgi:hypothetical protein
VMPKVQQALHRSHAGRRERIGTFDTRYPGPETGVLPLWVQADPITLTYPSEFVTRVSDAYYIPMDSRGAKINFLQVFSTQLQCSNCRYDRSMHLLTAPLDEPCVPPT